MSSSKPTAKTSEAEIQLRASQPASTSCAPLRSRDTELSIISEEDNGNESRIGPAMAEETTTEAAMTIPHRTLSVAMNPLAGMSEQQVLLDSELFMARHGLLRHREAFRKGSLAALTQHERGGYQRLNSLSQRDKDILRYEEKHAWKSNPAQLYFLCALCAGCAIVQGADQTVINGAQEFYFEEFAITDPLLRGLTNGAPYASAASLGCWLNAPLNHWFGRRGTIVIGCLLACLTAIWQAVAPSWGVFLAGRFALGLAVGAKSATTPIYAAECAPKAIRGALVMMWQMFTAFGIMLGFVISLAFQDMTSWGPNSQWRWMLGVTAIPPFIVGHLVYLQPESPRWYMDKGKFAAAFKSLQRLRKNDILAARDLYLAHKFLEVERAMQRHNTAAGASGRGAFLEKIWGTWKEFFLVRRNRRAAQSAWFCMFMQQFCGVNIIAYYSTKIFSDAGYPRDIALLISFGGGVCNFLGALPAVFTIDKFGRRNLLVSTFPVMALLLAWTSCSFQMEESHTRLILITVSLYAFMLVYSPGMGPVPFTYSAEAFPLHIRAVGMASATSITWAFNFLISFTWPKMAETFTVSGSFAWYAGWNLFGFIFTYFMIPETKNKTLEELDAVFSVRSRDHAKYYAIKLKREWEKLIGKDPTPLPTLNAVANEEEEPKPDEV